MFEGGEIGSRKYELDLFGSLLYPGDYCLRSFVYFTDLLSNGSIDLLFDYSSSSSSSLNQNESIQLNSSSILDNRWNELRQDFRLNSLPSKVRLLSKEKKIPSSFKVSFIFRRGISNSNSFAIALDQLTILDQPCRKNLFKTFSLCHSSPICSEPFPTITTTPEPVRH